MTCPKATVVVLIVALLVSSPVLGQESLDGERELHGRLNAAVTRSDPAWREGVYRPRKKGPFSTLTRDLTLRFGSLFVREVEQAQRDGLVK
jgi:hypothetical protein